MGVSIVEQKARPTDPDAPDVAGLVQRFDLDEACLTQIRCAHRRLAKLAQGETSRYRVRQNGNAFDFGIHLIYLIFRPFGSVDPV